MNEINKETIDKLFFDNDIFNNIKDEMKKALVEKIATKTWDLKEVNTRVAHDFLWYLIKERKIDIKNYLDSLTNYLTVIATLNNRKTITQSDLILLTEINMDELGIDNWNGIINSAIKNTMFRKFTIVLDKNNDLKENMGFRLDDNKVTKQDYVEAKAQRDWLDEVIPQVEHGKQLALQSDQLKNVFFQDNIDSFFDNSVNELLGRMKFQRLGFDTIVKSETK